MHASPPHRAVRSLAIAVVLQAMFVSSLSLRRTIPSPPGCRWSWRAAARAATAVTRRLQARDTAILAGLVATQPPADAERTGRALVTGAAGGLLAATRPPQEA